MGLIEAMLDRARETQHEHTRILKVIVRQQSELLELLQQKQQNNNHGSQGVDWDKHLPRILWIAGVVTLVTANLLAPDIASTVSPLP